MKLPTADCRLPIASSNDAGQARHSSFVIRHLKARAFTLIEVMVAVAVFSMVVAAIYATFALVLRASQVGQEAAAQAQRQRVVLRAIGDALMGIESFQASQQYYWFKLQNGGEPYLSFVSRLPDTYPRNGKFVGTAGGRDANTRRVVFSLAAGEDGGKDLVLQQKPLLMDMDDDEQKYPLVLAKNVKDFTIEWWGTNDMGRVDWFKDWDDKQTNTIPQMLRVHLVLAAKAEKSSFNNNSAADFVATRIYTVPSEMMPVFVQRGTGPGPGGGPGGGPTLQLPPGKGQQGGQLHF